VAVVVTETNIADDTYDCGSAAVSTYELHLSAESRLRASHHERDAFCDDG
jgi:hypothetical protein